MFDHVKHMKEVVKHLTAAQQLLSRGPIDYYFAKLVEHSDALCSRFAPLKVDQRAVILRRIKCTGNWSGHDRTLRIGAVGAVYGVDYCEGGFRFDFLPDRVWHKSADGVEYDSGPTHTFCMREGDIGPIHSEEADVPEVTAQPVEWSK